MDKALDILLIDDDVVDQEAVRRALNSSSLKFRLSVASNGLEGLEALHGIDRSMTSGKLPLILLDLNMPRMNGFEFLKELRAHPELESAVVFVLSTSQRDEDVKVSYEYGVAGYVSKNSMAADFTLLGQFLHSYWRLVHFPC